MTEGEKLIKLLELLRKEQDAFCIAQGNDPYGEFRLEVLAMLLRMAKLTRPEVVLISMANASGMLAAVCYTASHMICGKESESLAGLSEVTGVIMAEITAGHIAEMK